MIPYEKKECYTVDDLVEIVALLRSKEGCPWDKEQSHTSIRTDLIEETYEVIEAIDQNDPAMLREELGDLLLQVVFHTQIEREQGTFTLEDVCTEICDKMITRHPHVFSTTEADTTEEVLRNWDSIKEQTKHQTTRTDTLEAVAKPLPALLRAQKVWKRATKGEPSFLQRESVSAEFAVRLQSLEQAVQTGDAEAVDHAMGELLFCCTATAQLLGVKAEQALTDTTNRFIRRFAIAESMCMKQNRSLESLTDEEWAAVTEKEEVEHAIG